MRVYATLSAIFVAFLFESAALTGGMTTAGKYALSAVIIGIALVILGVIWSDDR